MRLTIGNFIVNEIQFGSETRFQNGLLTINKEEALKMVLENEHITQAEIHLVKPGDDARIFQSWEIY